MLDNGVVNKDVHSNTNCQLSLNLTIQIYFKISSYLEQPCQHDTIIVSPNICFSVKYYPFVVYRTLQPCTGRIIILFLSRSCSLVYSLTVNLDSIFPAQFNRPLFSFTRWHRLRPFVRIFLCVGEHKIRYLFFTKIYVLNETIEYNAPRQREQPFVVYHNVNILQRVQQYRKRSIIIIILILRCIMNGF